MAKLLRSTNEVIFKSGRRVNANVISFDISEYIINQEMDKIKLETEYIPELKDLTQNEYDELLHHILKQWGKFINNFLLSLPPQYNFSLTQYDEIEVALKSWSIVEKHKSKYKAKLLIEAMLTTYYLLTRDASRELVLRSVYRTKRRYYKYSVYLIEAYWWYTDYLDYMVAYVDFGYDLYPTK